MQSVSFPKNTPFDKVTGDLRPEYRDAYLLGQLGPVVSQQVVAYLQKSPIQKSVLLGRYHELSAQATQTGRTLVPPRWVQQQLLRQASQSAAGPLRRPLVRVVLGVVLALCLASGVQWLRNEPLLPAPVVAAVGRAASSARAATRQLVARLTVPNAPALAPAAPRSAPVRRPPAPRRAAAEDFAVLAARPATIASLAPDSALVPALPVRLEVPAAASSVVVHGRISDTGGRPLPGATVLVPGTALATSANASGDYSLTAPTGTQLQFGYGGYSDQTLPATAGTLDVTLAPLTKKAGARKR